MSIAELINRPCTLFRRSASAELNDYGDAVVLETTEETFCELQQQQRTEPVAAGELSQTTWLLILPAGTELDTSDAIEVDGRRYELIGDPWSVRSPRTQQEHHVEATVRQTGEASGS